MRAASLEMKEKFKHAAKLLAIFSCIACAETNIDHSNISPLNQSISCDSTAETLFIYVNDGDVSGLMSVASSPIDVNCIDPRTGESLLLRALMLNKLEIANFLLKRGADVNYRRSGLLGSPSAIELAVFGFEQLKNEKSKKISLDNIEYMLKMGADVNVRTKNGGTILINAMRTGSLELVQIMLRAGADPNVPEVISLADGITFSPLEVAITNCNVEMVRAALIHGAKVDDKVRHAASRLCLPAVDILGIRNN